MIIIRLGNIYLITNQTNQKKYVGQTARDIDVRFVEHCSETRGHSRLHNAIQAEGFRNFKVSLLEQVPLDQLDEREKYWIAELNTQNPDIGYNIAPGGKNNFNPYKKIQVVENGLIFDSKEEMSRLLQQTTAWSMRFISSQIRKVLDNNDTFFNYHLIEMPPETVPSDDDVLIDWIKTLNIQYQGKHIFCEELNQEFDTISQASQYLLENNLYKTESKTPLQSLITSISKNLRGKTEYVNGVQEFHFQYVPGKTTKQPGSDNNFQPKKIYCPELDKTFGSLTEAGHYFIDNKIWQGIVFKTAKCRISDIIRGVFPDYRGYTFKEIE